MHTHTDRRGPSLCVCVDWGVGQLERWGPKKQSSNQAISLLLQVHVCGCVEIRVPAVLIQSKPNESAGGLRGKGGRCVAPAWSLCVDAQRRRKSRGKSWHTVVSHMSHTAPPKKNTDYAQAENKACLSRHRREAYNQHTTFDRRPSFVARLGGSVVERRGQIACASAVILVHSSPPLQHPTIATLAQVHVFNLLNLHSSPPDHEKQSKRERRRERLKHRTHPLPPFTARTGRHKAAHRGRFWAKGALEHRQRRAG